jgi:hypothetical protein
MMPADKGIPALYDGNVSYSVTDRCHNCVTTWHLIPPCDFYLATLAEYKNGIVEYEENAAKCSNR